MSPRKHSDSEKTELIGLRLPSALIKRIERWSKKAGKMSKSDALRDLIARGLEAVEGPPAPAWAAQLEELAARCGTDAAGAVELMREYLDAPEAPPPGAPAKPRRGGVLRSLLF